MQKYTFLLKNKLKVTFFLVHSYLLNGQSTVHPAHLLEFPGFFVLSSQEQLPLPMRRARMATTTRANTTNSTMTVGKFMR